MRYWFFFLCAMQLMAASIVKEASAAGVWVEARWNDSGDLSELAFSDESRIQYEYQDRRLVKITRLNPSGEEMYAHTYEWDGARLISEAGWFNTYYTYDDQGRIIAQSNPWYQEIIEYDVSGKLVRAGDRIYSYNHAGEVIGEEGRFHAAYDDQHNLLALNSSRIEVNEQNQIIGLQYDIRGNLLREGFVYDEQNQLIEAGGQSYTYDANGRRIGKGETAYLYLGFEEIASFEEGRCKTLKVPGIGRVVAIEIDGNPYAPVIDAQGIIRKLIDPATNSVFREISSDVFGQGITDAIPYAYRGKRYDPETGLIYFGLRYYDPAQHRWLTPDPLGAIDHANLYQYVYNNPVSYFDPDGTFAMAIPLLNLAWGTGAVITCPVWGTAAIATAAGAAVGWATYEVIQKVKEGNQKGGVFKPGAGEKLVQEYKTPPRFNGKELGSDPSRCPEEGFEWRGKGSPESGRGNWINPETGESLHPDHNHPPGKAPHWGYINPAGGKYDLFLDGSWQ